MSLLSAGRKKTTRLPDVLQCLKVGHAIREWTRTLQCPSLNRASVGSSSSPTVAVDPMHAYTVSRSIALSSFQVHVQL